MVRRACLLLLAVLAAANATGGTQLTVTAGDRLSVTAEKAPLRDVLSLLARQGVSVLVDPEIDTHVTARFTQLDMEKGLRRLVSPNDFVLVWAVVKTPMGPLPRLSEVRVFRPGREDRLASLPAPRRAARALAVATNAVTLVVPGEVLVRLKAGTKLDPFRAVLARTSTTVADCFEPGAIYLLRTAPDADLTALLAELRRSGIVETAEPNYVYKLAPPSAQAGAASPGSAAVDRTGKPAAVAVLDSGLRAQAGLGELVVASLDATDPKRAIGDAVGHGTHMALIASGLASPQGASVASQAAIIAIRAFDDEGYASTFGLLRAMTFAADQGAKVVNMSWESNADSAFLNEAVAYALNKDIVLVAAAGNSPSGQAVYPAAIPGVVAVSALAPDGAVWDQSNYGDFVTLSAPALAALPKSEGTGTGLYIGTSIASAYVAHALAEYRTRHPEATSADAVRALLGALTDAGAPGRDPRYGAGAFDAAAQRAFAAR
jgi:hypothetical protein